LNLAVGRDSYRRQKPKRLLSRKAAGEGALTLFEALGLSGFRCQPPKIRKLAPGQLTGSGHKKAHFGCPVALRNHAYQAEDPCFKRPTLVPPSPFFHYSARVGNVQEKNIISPSSGLLPHAFLRMNASLPKLLSHPQTALLKRQSGRAIRAFSTVVLRSMASLLALFALFGFNPQALAATDTWTGADAGPSTDWATGDNWLYSAGTGPVASGDSLIFTGTNGSGSTLLTNSLTNSGFLINGITFNAGSPAYIMSGNGFELGGAIVNRSTNTETFNNAITLSANESLVTNASGGNLIFGGGILGGNVGININGGGTVILDGAASTYAGVTTVNSSTLVENFAFASTPASNLINSSSALSLGGGDLLLNGNASTANSQTFAATTIGAGGSAITLSANATANPLLLNLGAITRNTGGTVVFSLPSGTGTQGSTNGVVTSTSVTSGVLPWAVVSGTGTAANGSANGFTFATVSSGNIAPYITATSATNAAAAWGGIGSGNNSTVNYDVSANGTFPVTGVQRNVNTIRYTGTGATEQSNGNSASLLVMNGFMNAGTGLFTSGGGSFYLGIEIGSNNELVLAAETAGIKINNGIENDGATPSALTTTGAGSNAVTLAGTNTYTGATYIDQPGTLNLTGTLGSGSGGGTAITNAGTFSETTTGAIIGASSLTSVSGTTTLAGTNNYTGATTITAGTLSLTGTLGSGSGGGTAITNAGAFSETNTGAITGTSALTNVAGTTTLAGANTYTGATIINGGSLSLTGALGSGSGGGTAITNSGAFSETSTGAITGTSALTNVAGTTTLAGANTYTGATTAAGGTLDFANASSLYNGTTASWTASDIIVQNGATLAVQVGSSPNFTSANIGALLGMTSSATGGFETGSNLGIDTTPGNFIYSGGIANAYAGSTLGLAKLGANTLTLTGGNTYTGPTNVDAGTLALGATGEVLNNTAVTVANGATLAAAPSTGGISIGSAGGASLTLSGGSSLLLGSGSAVSAETTTFNTFTLNGNLSIGGSSTSAGLTFDLDNTSNDELVITGAVSFGTGGGIINIIVPNLSTAPSGAMQTYTLVSAGSGLLSVGGFTLAPLSHVITLGGNNYSVSLSETGGTTETLTLNQTNLSLTYYWVGGASASWGVPGNFATDHTGAVLQTTQLASDNNVILTADSPNGTHTASQTLDNSYAINSLTFSSSAPAESLGTGSGGHGGSNTLTLDAANGFSTTTGASPVTTAYGSGIGLEMQNGSAAQILNVPVALGGSQTWEIDSATNALTVQGAISDGGAGYSLTKTGVGILILSAANTYSGGTFVSAGTLMLGDGGSLLSTGALTVSGATFDLAGNNQTVASLSDGGVSTGTITSSSLTPTLSIGNGTFGGTISGNLSLVENGSSTLTLSGSNSYTGITTVASGTLVAATNSALGSSASSASGLVMSGNSIADFISSAPSIAALTGATGNSIVLGNSASGGSATTLTITGAGAGTGTTFAGVISDLSASNGVGNLTLSSGNLTLSGANTFTGTTLISGGTLTLGNSLALQNSTLNLGSSGAVSFSALTTVPVRGLTGSGSLVLTNTNGAGVNLTIASNITNTYTGNISGAGGLILAGAGVLVLSGSNSFGGGIAIGATSTLQLQANASNTASGNSNVMPSQNVTLAQFPSGTTIQLRADSTAASGGIVAFDSGATEFGGNSAGTRFSGIFNFDVNQLTTGSTATTLQLGSPAIASADTGWQVGSGATGTSTTFNVTGGDGYSLQLGGLYVGNNYSLIFNPTTANLIIGGIGNNSTGGITKNGAGTLTITGPGTSTGATSITAGILNYQNGIAFGTNSAITVSNGATAQVQGGIPGGTQTLTLGGVGAANATGALENVSGANSFSGLLTLTGPATISSDAGSLSLANAGTINGNGDNLTLTGAGNGSIAGIIGTGAGALTKSGAGTWTLSGANTYTGVTTITGGTLDFPYSSSLYNGATASWTASNIIVQNGATLVVQVGSSSPYFTSANLGTLLGMASSATGGFETGSTLALDTTAGNFTYSAGIANAYGGSTLGITKLGANSLTLTSVNTYTGPTNVKAGTLALGATGEVLNNTAITVANGATLAAVPSTGSLSIGSTGGASLTLSGGSSLLLGGNSAGSAETTTFNTLTLNGNLSIGGSGAPADLTFDLDNTSNDELIVTGAVSFGAGGGVINIIVPSSSAAPAGASLSYILITAAGGLASGAGDLTLGTGSQIIALGSNQYIATLGTSGVGGTEETLNLTKVSLSYYWKGGTSASWSIPGNFTADHTGAVLQTTQLGANNNVVLTADSPSGTNTASQTLDNSYTVNSLTFSSVAPATTLGTGAGGNGASNTLTLNAVNGFSVTAGIAPVTVTYGAGTGLVMQNGAAAQNLNVPVVLGGSQTWEIDSLTNALTIQGTISDGGTGYSLTKTGAGTLILSAANTYSGGTVVSAGTLILGAGGSLLSMGALTVDGGALNLAGNNQTVASLSDGGVSTGTITSSIGAGTLTINNTTPNTYSGTITDENTVNNTSSLALVLQSSSNVTLSGSNSFTGGTTLVSGNITAASNYALGNPTSQNANAGLTFNNSSSATAYFTSANPQVASINNGASETGPANIILGNTSNGGSSTTLYIGAGGSAQTFAGDIFSGTISDLSGSAATAVGNLQIIDGAFVELMGANTFTGTTVISGSGTFGDSTLELGNSNALENSTVYLNNPEGILSFGSLTSATIGGLTGNQGLALANANSIAITLNVGNNNVSSVYTGNLSGAGGLAKGGNGTVQIGTGTNGGATYAGLTSVNAGTLIIGGTSDLTSGVTVSQGTLVVQDDAIINSAAALYLDNVGGFPGPANLIVSGTASVTVPTFSFGSDTRASGVVTVQNSGSLIVNGAYDFLNDLAGTSTSANTVTNLNGGTLAVQNFVLANAGAGATTATSLNFNGGTLEALANDPSGTYFLPAIGKFTANVQAGGAIINTNGFNITIAQPLVSGTANDGGLTKIGNGVLTLAGTNTYAGPTNINGGELAVSSSNGISTTSAITFGGGAFQYTNLNTKDYSPKFLNSLAPVTIDVNGQAITFASSIAASNTGGLTLEDAIANTGSLTLTSPNAYSGPTTINSGATLVLGSGGAFPDSVITVNGTLLAQAGNGGIGVSSASLNLGPGSTLSLVDGAIGALTINGGVSIGGTSSPAALNFEIDTDTSAADNIIVNGVALNFGSRGGLITLTDIGATTVPTSGTEFTLITDASGLGTHAFTLSQGSLLIDGQNFLLSLGNSTSTAEILTLTQGSASYYWTGLNSASWKSVGNFTADAAGTQVRTGSLSAGSDIFLTANTATHFSQTLDGNYAINSLNFTGTGTSAAANPVTLASGTGTALTIEATGPFQDAQGNTYSAGTGLVAQPGAAANTISANINLGNGQSWQINNSSSNPLTVSGVIADAPGTTLDSLTKSGSGTLVLSNANTYDGGTAVQAGTLALGAGGSLVATGTLSVAGTFDLAGQNQTVAGLSDGGVSTGVITSSTGAAMLTINNSSANSFSGTIRGNLGLTSNTLTLTGANTYTGPTTITSGTLTIAGAGQLSSGSYAGSISNAGTINYNSSAAQTLSGTISGAGAIVDSGAGMLTLSGSNSFTGGITNGANNILQLQANAANTASGVSYVMPAQNMTSAQLVSGATIQLRADSSVASGGIVAFGSGATEFGGNTAGSRLGGTYNFDVIQLTAGTNLTLQFGPTTAVGPSTGWQIGGTTGGTATFNVTGGNGYSLQMDGIYVGNNYNLVFNPTTANLIVGAILNVSTGGVTKNGAGTLTFTGTNNYTGPTTINAGGALIVSGSITGSSATTVSSGGNLEIDGLLNNSISATVNGRLSGTGVIGGAAINGGGALAPGLTVANSSISAGTLTATGNVSLASASTLSIRFGVTTGQASNPATGLGGDADQLFMNGGTLSLNNTVLQLLAGSAAMAATPGSLYVIVNGGAASTGNGTDVFAGLPASGDNFTASNGEIFDVFYGVNAGNTAIGNDIDVELVAVPEPGAWSMVLAGLGALCLCRRGRRRRGV
jgi:fibronectin-binding autotransporter adhesin